VSAAGNDHSPTNGAPGVTYPAADPNVLGVGAVWDGDQGGPWEWDGGAIDESTGPHRIVSFTQRAPGVGMLSAPRTPLTGANLGSRPVGANSSPVLSGNGQTTTLPEDAVNPAGARIGDLLGATFSDSDVGSRRGIAVVGLTGNGRWQYSLDAGRTWLDAAG